MTLALPEWGTFPTVEVGSYLMSPDILSDPDVMLVYREWRAARKLQEDADNLASQELGRLGGGEILTPTIENLQKRLNAAVRRSSRVDAAVVQPVQVEVPAYCVPMPPGIYTAIVDPVNNTETIMFDDYERKPMEAPSVETRGLVGLVCLIVLVSFIGWCGWMIFTGAWTVEALRHALSLSPIAMGRMCWTKTVAL